MVKKYSISVVSASCGIKTHTLRAWEKRYKIFNPERSESGQRLYGDEDLAKAKLIVSLLDYGHSISSLANHSIYDLKKMKKNHDLSKSENVKNIEINQLKQIIKNLTNYEIDLLANELQHARMNMGARSFVLNLVLPVIRQVGLLVAKGKISITQEHIVSTIIRDQLVSTSLPNTGKTELDFALATPDGNLHEFSIIIADILCRSHRLSTRYLGGSHPAISLGEALNVFKSPVLILGVVSSDKWIYEEKIIPYLKDVDSVLKHKVIIILGGGHQLDFPVFDKIDDIKILKTFEDFDEYLKRIN